MLAEQKNKQAAYDARKKSGRKVSGSRPADEVSLGKHPAKSGPAPRVSVTDPASRRMKTKVGFVQGYNAQIAVTADQIILGGLVTQIPTDHHLLPGVLEAVTAALSAAGISEGLDTVLADAGYANETTFTHLENADLVLLAPVISDARRALGQDPGGDRDLSKLPATARAQQRLRTPKAQAQYKLRGQTAEPVFGQLKDRGGLRQFARRGLANVTAEFLLGCTVHNLRKLHSFTLAQPSA